MQDRDTLTQETQRGETSNVRVIKKETSYVFVQQPCLGDGEIVDEKVAHGLAVHDSGPLSVVKQIES